MLKTICCLVLGGSILAGGLLIEDSRLTWSVRESVEFKLLIGNSTNAYAEWYLVGLLPEDFEPYEAEFLFMDLNQREVSKAKYKEEMIQVEETVSKGAFIEPRGLDVVAEFTSELFSFDLEDSEYYFIWAYGADAAESLKLKNFGYERVRLDQDESSCFLYLSSLIALSLLG
uniref:Uncharacterized protein n=1 Tax=Fabrea salina TaxID=342563 RepID=A0A7S3IA76_9CILI|mmetsp:Transcript_1332/g.2111  ORF Transcript_1332/g.2111 Transcript_1332/m.2111 type:complete len:172 (+) Transcript_1332:62-577(+)